MTPDDPTRKRISRSERYKRRIAGLSGQIREMAEIIAGVEPDLPPQRREEIRAAMQRAKLGKQLNV